MVPGRATARIRGQQPLGISGGDLDHERQRQARRALTSFGSISAAPTWSPDGRIAYFTLCDFPPPASEDDPPPPAEIHSMTADGADDQRLTNDTEIQTDPSWSPDGSTIAYIHWCEVPGEEGAFDLGLYAMNRDGTQQRPLLACSPKRFISNANWSPDGRRIVLEVATARPRGRSGGRAERHRADQRRRDRPPAPHPDGRARDAPGLVARRPADRVHQRPARQARSARAARPRIRAVHDASRRPPPSGASPATASRTSTRTGSQSADLATGHADQKQGGHHVAATRRTGEFIGGPANMRRSAGSSTR